jgi:esterase/lipase superfamily enzyme
LKKFETAIFTLLLAGLCGCAARLDPDRRFAGGASANFTMVDVFYATDRNPLESVHLGRAYGAERNTRIEYGRAQVSIPRNHKIGELEDPFFKLVFRPDPNDHVMLHKVEALDERRYYELVNDRARKPAKKSAFVFVHGYNVSFEDAARRTAQLAYDLKFDGAPVFYSWPSRAKEVDYVADEGNVAWSETNLANFLTSFAQKTDAEKIVVIGHSMGTRALANAYVRVVVGNPALRSRFSEIILAAPDIDADVFARDIAPKLAEKPTQVTIYASSNDIPLMVSKRVHKAARLGESGEKIAVVKNIESIDASLLKTDFLNHSYAMENRSVVSDMFHILRNGLRASNRAGLEPVTAPSGGSYWKFAK